MRQRLTRLKSSLLVNPVSQIKEPVANADNSGSNEFFAIAVIGMVASIIGSFFVKGGDSTESHALSRALHMGTNVAMAITALASVGAARRLA